MRWIFVLVLLTGFGKLLAAQTLLKTAFQDTPSKVVRHLDGTLGGICIDLMNLVERHSDYRFDRPQQFVSLKRIERDLESRDLDVYFALLKSPDREKICTFVEPLYSIRYVLVGLADDSGDIQTIEDLKSAAGQKPVLTLFGSTIADYIRSLGLACDDSGLTVEQNLGKLLTHRARYLIYQDIAVRYEVSRLALKEKLKVYPLVLRTEEMWLVSSRGVRPSVNDDLRSTIRLLKSTGEWKAVVDRYIR